MARITWQGRLGLTREKAKNRAEARDAKTHEDVSERLHASPHGVLSQIRAYLIRRSAEIEAGNNPIQLLKLRQDAHGMAAIFLGPAFDKGPTPEHFYFDSGARLSFGLTLRERGRDSELVGYRFHYQMPEGKSPEYFGFHLNQAPHEDPLIEPRCHLHPGIKNVRIPLSMYDPIEILDQVFFVIDKNI